MDLETPAVSAEYVHAFLRLFKHLGYPDDLLQTITAVPLDQFTSSDAVISTQELLNIIDRGMRAINMPYAGLALGNQMTLTTHGMAGVAAMTQQAYADALRLASRACDSIFPGLQMEMVEDEREVSLVIRERMSLKPYFHFFVEVVFVNFYNIMHFLLGDDIEPARLCFSYASPSYSHIYRRYFRCPLRFNDNRCAFVVTRAVASRPLSLANNHIAMKAEHQVTEALPETMMELLPQKLRNTLVQNFDAFPSLEKAARKLGMSGRTLRRQLHLAGTSFQQELDEVRKEFSLSYLLRSDISITEIAISLGFNDSSAFSRAFKKWTGEPPRDYRRRFSNCAQNAKNIFGFERKDENKMRDNALTKLNEKETDIVDV